MLWTCLVGTLFALNWSAAPAQTDGTLPPLDDVVPDLREPLGKWEKTGTPHSNHDYSVQRPLPGGKVFRYARSDPEEPAGSASERARPEIFDPKADQGRGKWIAASLPEVATGSEGTRRQGAQIQSATLVGGTPAECGNNCAKVLVHFRVCFPSDGTVWQLYDPHSDTWTDALSPGPAPSFGRSASSAAALTLNCGAYCGHIVVLGAGRDCGSEGEARNHTEWYNPLGGWRLGNQTNGQYVDWAPVAVPLRDGRVLSVGCGVENVAGEPQFVPVSEIFDPATPVWVKTTNAPPHCVNDSSEFGGPFVAVLDDGRVFVMGYDSNDSFDTHAQLFDPDGSSWSDIPAGSRKPCCGKGALLPGGRVLIVKQGSAVLWTPPRRGTADPLDSTVPASAPDRIRSPHAATLLAGDACGRHCGKVLLTGRTEEGSIAAELYTPPPDLLSLAPAEGPVTGGTRVDINGYSFIGDESSLSVEFGGVRGKDLEILSDRKLRVTAPEGAAPGAVAVRVITPGGKTPDGEVSRFSYLPAITALRPDRVKMQGGVEISILGKGLSKTESVRFGAVGANSFRIASDNEVVAVAPSHSRPEIVPVSLTAAGLRSVPSSAGTNLLTYFSDDPLGRLQDDIDDTVPSVISQGSAGGGTQTPLSAIAPTQGSSFTSSLPGSGPPSLPNPPPSGPLAAPATLEAPQAAIRAMASNPPFLQPSSASALSQSVEMGPSAGVVVGHETNPESEPGIRYAMIALSAITLARIAGAGILDRTPYRCGFRPSDDGFDLGPSLRTPQELSFQTAY